MTWLERRTWSALAEATFAGGMRPPPEFLMNLQIMLGAMDRRTQMMIRLGLVLFDAAGGPFHAAPPRRRQRIVARWEHCGWYPPRALFLGLKSLCGLAYASLPAVERP